MITGRSEDYFINTHDITSDNSDLAERNFENIGLLQKMEIRTRIDIVTLTSSCKNKKYIYNDFLCSFFFVSYKRYVNSHIDI